MPTFTRHTYAIYTHWNLTLTQLGYTLFPDTHYVQRHSFELFDKLAICQLGGDNGQRYLKLSKIII